MAWRVQADGLTEPFTSVDHQFIQTNPRMNSNGNLENRKMQG